MEAGAGVEDLDADEAVVFPVERDEPAGAARRGGLQGGAARLLEVIDGVPGVRAVPLGSSVGPMEGTTQDEARDAWAEREGNYMVARGPRRRAGPPEPRGDYIVDRLGAS